MVGMGRATDLLFRNKPVTAESAEYGLGDAVVPPEKVDGLEALALATELAQGRRQRHLVARSNS